MSHSLAVSLKKNMTILLVLALLLATATLGGSTATAISQPANFQVYLKLDSIPGESTARGYEQWIPVSDVQFGVENTPLSPTAPGRPSLNGVRFAKVFDAASMPIFLASLQGKHIKSATFVFVKQLAAPVKFLTLNLNDVLVTSYSFDDTVESVSLDYKVISVGYSSQKPDGSMSAMIKSAWDVAKGTVTTPVIP
ncbi:Hcp family type VI secretion system effector [Cohnella soli]|uniref:Hcp family type VI secretion system effector n=1 Tax=Cohnella soli TaxID=425005 RepID=A0ABW0HRB4_9BACL